MRKSQTPKRFISPDPVYNSILLAKAINIVMLDGKKKLAQTIFYKAMNIIKEKTNKCPLEVFQKALKNTSPTVVLKTRRIGGANYQVPAEAPEYRKEMLAMRWLVVYSRKREERGMAERLSAEIIDAYNNTGLSIKRKNELIKMAESNKAFAYFRF